MRSRKRGFSVPLFGEPLSATKKNYFKELEETFSVFSL